MRILIYSYNYYPELIGMAPLMTELAEGLVKRGHQVRVVTGMPNYPERRIYPKYQGKWYLTEEKNSVLIQRSYVWVRPNTRLFGKILLDGSFVISSFPQALKGWRPDVILATILPLPVFVPAALLGWFKNCPVVLNIQDIVTDGVIQVGLLHNKLLIHIFQALEKFAYQNATKISVIADGFMENLLSKGVPASKIIQIPNWVDINFIRPLLKRNSSFWIEHQLTNKFVILYSGNIGLKQDLDTVFRAASCLEHMPEIIFVIVGEKNVLEELRRRYQPADNVLLLELQPREKLPELLAAADVGLVMQKKNIFFNMPSKIPVLLASGRVIVASIPNNSSAAKALQQSGGGIVVAPENHNALVKAILDLYANPEQVKMLGQQGRKYAVENYSFEQGTSHFGKKKKKEIFNSRVLIAN